jgi:nucleotide-binding universal stress UspA family protein
MLPFKNILFPVDFSEHSWAARYLEAFAGRFESKLTLLHVIEPPKYNDLRPESRAQRQARIGSFLAKELEYFRIERVLVDGDPASSISSCFQRTAWGAFRRFLIGSITAKVLHDAERPVWTGEHLEQVPPLEKI